MMEETRHSCYVLATQKAGVIMQHYYGSTQGTINQVITEDLFNRISGEQHNYLVAIFKIKHHETSKI